MLFVYNVSEPKPDYPPISIENYRQQALEQHNVYRRMHCVGPVKLNASLNNIAQATAEDLAARNIFQHSGKKFKGQWMGENLFASSGGKPLYQKGTLFHAIVFFTFSICVCVYVFVQVPCQLHLGTVKFNITIGQIRDLQ